MFYNYIILVSGVLLLTQCRSLQCEEHYISQGFTGKVTITFNQNKEGENEKLSKGGCRIYEIPKSGVLKTKFSSNQGFNSMEAIRFFQVNEDSSITEIYDFNFERFIVDSANYRNTKFIYNINNGIQGKEQEVMYYYVDYGANFREYYDPLDTK